LFVRLPRFAFCYPNFVRMLWWLLILGVSAAVVVSVAILLYLRVRRQLKEAAGRPSESAPSDRG